MRYFHKLTISSFITFVAIVMGVFFAWLILSNSELTFADNEEIAQETSESDNHGSHFVTIYDNGKKLIVKTNAPTVAEVLTRANINIETSDIVEPSLDSPISTDNFYINIYRSHPAIIIDGSSEKYFMTASYDPITIAGDAGLVVYDGDEITPVVNNNFLEIGAAKVYQITRNGGRTITINEEIAFGEETIKDYNLSPGTSEVRQPGEIGEKNLVYQAFYINNVEVSRELVSETITKEPVNRIVAVGASQIEMNPLTVSKGRNRYTITKPNGSVVERQETYYDLPMSGVMSYCGGGNYHVRSDGVKVDDDGYVLIAANLNRYPRCSVVETSLGAGKVYDTGGFAASNPEQFDIATDWSNRDGI